jgi:hypothetical protein
MPHAQPKHTGAATDFIIEMTRRRFGRRIEKTRATEASTRF